MLTEAQRRATQKHLEKLDDIKVRVPKGKREEYKAFAAARGMSLNALLVELMEQEMARNK